ncbi:MAG: formate dehydrogenase accessory protein FdhE [Desulfomonilaceae bacterium]
MNHEAEPLNPTAQSLREQLESIKHELPHLSSIIDGCKHLVIAQAELRERLPLADVSDLVFDSMAFAQGAPLLSKVEFRIERELFEEAADSIIAALQTGFPIIADQFEKVRAALHSEDDLQGDFLESLARGNEANLEDQAQKLQVVPELLEMVVAETLKPFAQKRAESLPPLPESAHWTKGYCPVCGSWPELSFLEGKEGARWLRCAFCGHEWRYMRVQCPFCETVDQELLELMYLEERPHERIELCNACKRYVLGIDQRNLAAPLAREIATMSMIHLDVIAQENDYTPGASYLWNNVAAED